MCRSCVAGRPDKFIPAACLLSAVTWENIENIALRALRVMSMLREDGRVEMWNDVANNFLENGWLHMCGVLTTSNLDDFDFFLSSSQLSTNHFTKLK